MFLRLLFCLFLAALATPLAAQTCPANLVRVAPDNRYTITEPVPGEQVVEDAITGLMWKRCPEGRSGANCETGSNSSLNWSGALGAADAANTWSYGGHGDWRLPNIIELYSLVETACRNPSINTYAFPQNGTFYFWSSTTYVPSLPTALDVVFDYGYVMAQLKTHAQHVRLVRGGSWLDDDANLSDLNLTGHPITPVFDPDTLNYSASVDAAVDQVEVNAVASGDGASVNIAGQGFELEHSTRTVELVHGTNTIPTQVIAEDNTTTRTYTIEVFRNATIALDAGTLAQTYDGTGRIVTATTTPAGFDYEVSYEGTGGTVYPMSTTPPVNVGSYAVIATLTEPGGFSGTDTGTLVVGMATGTVTFGTLSFPYNGNTHVVTAFITEEPATTCTVPQSPIGPAVGNYPVTASCTGTNYDATGAANASITAIAQVVPVMVPMNSPAWLLVLGVILLAVGLRARRSQ